MSELKMASFACLIMFPSLYEKYFKKIYILKLYIYKHRDVTFQLGLSQLCLIKYSKPKIVFEAFKEKKFGFHGSQISTD